MRVADTSALYAAFDADDAHHAKARAALLDPEPILVPAEILAETCATWHRKLGPQAARSAMKALLALPHVEVQPTWDDHFDNLQAAARDVFARSSRLNYPDAVVVAWCRSRRFRPFAFDQQLVKAVTSRA